MDNFNEDNLDALFQEGSERYDFPYREDAWASMDNMLDDQEKKRKKRFLGWWLLAGITVLVGIFGVKYFAGNQSSTLQVDPVKERETASLVSSNKNTVTEASVLNTTSSSEKTKEESGDRANSLNKKASTTDLSTKIISETIENNYPVRSPKNEAVDLTVQSNQPVSSIIENKTTSNRIISVAEGTSIVSSLSKTRTKKESPAILPTGGFTLLAEKQVDYSAITLPAIMLVEPVINSKGPETKLLNRFSVGVNAGPEFSFVDGFGEAKAGYYLGIELAYQISDHFELITGVGVSKKSYLGDGANYKAAPGFWTDQIVPMEFAGKCTVIEIPVAVNYYFNDAKENGWFTSLGATTYLMSDEWYDFIYDPAINRTDLKANWNGQMENSHLLGVGQVSFGYQHNLGKHTSLQVSPYAKIPLTGIGTGSVNLFSTGLRVTARFR